MNQHIKLLNPFSVSLNKPPYMTVETTPVYVNGDYRIYKYCKKHYLHTFKSIIFAERCAANPELINNLLTYTKPPEESRLYFDYERAKEAICEGMEAAKKLGFEIN